MKSLTRPPKKQARHCTATAKEKQLKLQCMYMQAANYSRGVHVGVHMLWSQADLRSRAAVRAVLQRGASSSGDISGVCLAWRTTTPSKPVASARSHRGS
jgi:hypothetical protein